MTYLLRDVDDKLWRSFKSAAALQGKTVKDLIIESIERIVKEQKA